MKTWMLFSLVFASSTVLSSFFFLIIDLYILIPVVIAQLFMSIAELIISRGMPTKKAKAEIETHPATA